MEWVVAWDSKSTQPPDLLLYRLDGQREVERGENLPPLMSCSDQLGHHSALPSQKKKKKLFKSPVCVFGERSLPDSAKRKKFQFLHPNRWMCSEIEKLTFN